MKSVMGFVAPAAGGIDYDGRPLAGVPVSARARLGIGYSPEGRRVFPGMTVRENLEVASRDRAAATRERLGEVYAMFPGSRRRLPRSAGSCRAGSSRCSRSAAR